MTTYRVTYGEPFCGWRDFTDQDRALEFAQTAITETPATITLIESENQT